MEFVYVRGRRREGVACGEGELFSSACVRYMTKEWQLDIFPKKQPNPQVFLYF